jgi:dolichyldiphosphatase
MHANINRQLHFTSSINCDHFSRLTGRTLASAKQFRPSYPLLSHCNIFPKPSVDPLCTMRNRGHTNSLKAGAASSSAAAASTSNEGNPAARQHHPLLNTINESTKWMVSAAVFSTLAVRRDLICAWWVLGSILAAVLCRGLKFALNEARPPTARKADPGMPSAHANSLGFLAMFVSVWAAHNGTARTSASISDLISSTLFSTSTSPLIFFLSLGIPALGLFLTWLRVALGYHTVEQVAVGWLLGSSIAVGWWYFGIKKALPLLVLMPELQFALYGVTTIAITLFSVSNVGRWIKEQRSIGKTK